MQPSPQYTLEELAERSEVPVRTIRYYIQRDLVPRPYGEKKGAYYTDQHLSQLMLIREWVSAGWSLDRIYREFIQPVDEGLRRTCPAINVQRVVRYELLPGVTVVVDPAQIHCSLSALEKQLTNLQHALFNGADQNDW